jgi:hypothetical protein
VLYLDIICARVRQGHGPKMLAAIEDLAFRLHCSIIELSPVDHAIPFYKRHGFRVCHDPNGDGDVAMQKDVGASAWNYAEVDKLYKSRAPVVFKSYKAARGPGDSPTYRRQNPNARLDLNARNGNKFNRRTGLPLTSARRP